MEPARKRADLKAHIAGVAAKLFYQHGIHAVGVDRIAAEAEVTKRTLYHHYASKDELIAAALRAAPIVNFPEEGDAVSRILGAFERMGEFLQVSEYRGCPYIFFTAELVDRRHPARRLIERRTAKRREWFLERARDAGASDPELLAEQLDVLFDGALASGAKRGDLRAAAAAIEAAKTLIGIARARRSLRSA